MMGVGGIKSVLRAAWVRGRRFAHGRGRVTLHGGATLTEYGTPGFDTFFGYHDITPFGSRDELLLAGRREVGQGRRAASTPLTLGVYDTHAPRPSFEPFAVSTAWCWQQSCRLQWFGGVASSKVLFNYSEAGAHRARVFDLGTRASVADYSRALYAISADGARGISLNFARLQRLRPGYGYDDIADASVGQSAPADDGLWLVDLVRGGADLILSLAQVASFAPVPSMHGATHYFNHILWNPAGTHFFFLHLWRLADGSRRSRALVWDMARGRCTALGPEGVVSHHCWVDDRTLIVFAHQAGVGMRYHSYDLDRGYRRTLGRFDLVEDGHPSISPVDGGLMVTDTYPDGLGEQSLLLYDVMRSRLTRVAQLYSPPQLRGEVRCDLHPRWSRGGDHLCVDSGHGGERRLCVIGIAGLRDGAAQPILQ
jgi:hypothetical protein